MEWQRVWLGNSKYDGENLYDKKLSYLRKPYKTREFSCLETNTLKISYILENSLWVSDQSSWLQMHIYRVCFPALPHFLIK